MNLATIPYATSEGWRNAVYASLMDDRLTEDDAKRLLSFRDQLELEPNDLNNRAIARIQEVTKARIMKIASQAALAGPDSETKIQDLHKAFDGSSLSPDEQRSLLISAWESALLEAIEDRLLTVEEEEALGLYLLSFNLTQKDVDTNDAYTHFVQAIVIREVTEGIIPQRIDISDLPINLQRSEQLVWAFTNVDYYEVKTRSEFRGGSQGVGIPVAKGIYYNPQQIRGQIHEWDETVHAGRGFLGITTKHIYFHGGGRSFRVLYNDIVSFEQFNDGFGLMRDGRDSKPEQFRTGEGWFVYNLVTNLARL